MTRSLTAEAVVCGAGIAGISAAYHLVRRGVRRIVLVDERAPLTLTSDKSTECYRDWWPAGPMVHLAGRSIELLEELAAATGDAFAMNRRGYAYVTADPARAREMERSARQIAAAGGGPLRVHRGSEGPPPQPEDLPGQPAGADLFLDRDSLRRRYPFLTPEAVALLQPRRCGWLAAQQLGMLLLERCRERGVRLISGRVEGVEIGGGRVAGVRLSGGEVERIATGHFIAAPGPRLGEVAAGLGLELPVINELHLKVTFEDELGVVPRDLPLMIWTDPVLLEWSAEERRQLAADPELAWLLGELPGGAHFRPEGGAGSRSLLLLWAYDTAPVEPVFPLPEVPLYPEVVLRGLARMVPGFSRYLEPGRLERMRRPFVDGGYYCKAPDNRPLIGPLAVPGAFVIGALSGYGIMVSQGAAELLAAHVTGGELPAWAADFSPERLDDPAYLAGLGEGAATAGQL